MMSPPPPPPPPPPPHDPHMMEANGRYYPTKPESPALIVFLNVVNGVTQLLIGSIVFSAIFLANALNSNIIFISSSLSQHIYLCVIGYVILMSQAILTMNPHAGWAHSLKYPHKRMIHWVMQITGSIIAIVGSVIRMNDLDENFTSAHAITGFVAMVLTILSLIGGILNLIFPVMMNGLLLKLLHICIGTVTISIAFIALCLGFNDTYRNVYNDTNADLSIALTIFALVGIIISACFKVSKKLRE